MSVLLDQVLGQLRPPLGVALVFVPDDADYIAEWVIDGADVLDLYEHGQVLGLSYAVSKYGKVSRCVVDRYQRSHGRGHGV